MRILNMNLSKGFSIQTYYNCTPISFEANYYTYFKSDDKKYSMQFFIFKRYFWSDT